MQLPTKNTSDNQLSILIRGILDAHQISNAVLALGDSGYTQKRLIADLIPIAREAFQFVTAPAINETTEELVAGQIARLTAFDDVKKQSESWSETQVGLWDDLRVAIEARAKQEFDQATTPEIKHILDLLIGVEETKDNEKLFLELSKNEKALQNLVSLQGFILSRGATDDDFMLFIPVLYNGLNKLQVNQWPTFISQIQLAIEALEKTTWGPDEIVGSDFLTSASLHNTFLDILRKEPTLKTLIDQIKTNSKALDDFTRPFALLAVFLSDIQEPIYDPIIAIEEPPIQTGNIITPIIVESPNVKAEKAFMDYYAILGIRNRKATKEAIQAAYEKRFNNFNVEGL